MMSRLDDDGYLSSDFTAIEEDDQQALWIGVRPVWHENKPGEIMVQICYQEKYNSGTLQGPVWLTPETWRELEHAVNWRLNHREPWWKRFLQALAH
jgi:hypothetical protein